MHAAQLVRTLCDLLLRVGVGGRVYHLLQDVQVPQKLVKCFEVGVTHPASRATPSNLQQGEVMSLADPFYGDCCSI